MLEILKANRAPFNCKICITNERQRERQREREREREREIYKDTEDRKRRLTRKV